MAKDLTTGSITRLIISLAMPGVLSLLGITINHFIDGIWVGRLGPEALAGLAPSSFIIWILYSFVDIMPVGLLAIISRYYGEKKPDRASETSQKVIQVVAFVSLIFMVGGLMFSRQIMTLVGVSEEVVNLGTIYLTVMAFCLPALFLTETYSSIFRAVGDTTTPMKLTLTAIVVNMIFDPLLIFGLGPFPRLEMAGAALATVLGYYFSLGLAIFEIARGKLPFKVLELKWLPIDMALIWRVAKIGIPISISGVVFSIVYLILSRIAAPFGDYVVASFRVGQLVESVSFMVCFGFSQATAGMVGQNLGALLPQRAEKSAWTAVGIISAFTILMSFFLFFFAGSITRIFTSDFNTLTATVLYLKIIAFSQLFMGFEVVLEGAFSGAGDTFPPMLVSILGTSLRVPLALILINIDGIGFLGLYLAITVSTVLKGLTILLWFKAGKWKTKKV
jgi:putative MATE family efflux protein